MLCLVCSTVLTGRSRRFCSKNCSDRFSGLSLSGSPAPLADATRRPRVGTLRGASTVRASATRGISTRRFSPVSEMVAGAVAALSLTARNGSRRRGSCVSATESAKVAEKTPAENGRALDVHHIVPFRFSGDNSPENGRALCRSFHMRAPDHGRRDSARFLRAVGLVTPMTKREIRERERRWRTRQRRAERKTLQSIARRRQREGASLRVIARELGVSHQTVKNWLGGLYEVVPPEQLSLLPQASEQTAESA